MGIVMGWEIYEREVEILMEEWSVREWEGEAREEVI